MSRLRPLSRQMMYGSRVLTHELYIINLLLLIFNLSTVSLQSATISLQLEGGITGFLISPIFNVSGIEIIIV